MLKLGCYGYSSLIVLWELSTCIHVVLLFDVCRNSLHVLCQCSNTVLSIDDATYCKYYMIVNAVTSLYLIMCSHIWTVFADIHISNSSFI